MTKTTHETLLHVVYRNGPDLLNEVEAFIARGEDLDAITEYGESALRVASNQRRFDVVLRLLAAGAAEYQLEWTETMLVLVRGTLADLADRLAETACSEIEVPDCWLRTPLLLAIQLGDIEKVALLLAQGANRGAVGRCGKTPLMYAVEQEDLPMLAFLLTAGFDLEARDEFGDTALEHSVREGKAENLRWLLQHGAHIRGNDQYGFPLIHDATTVAVAKILVEHGEDLSKISEEVHAELLGMRYGEAPDISQEDYLAARCREFGRANPEETSKPFWLAMIRCGGSAWHATNLFGDSPFDLEGTTWSYQRFGRSTTLMPDGRIIEIGGEHEMGSDPDFCIYNDVTVFDGAGGIRIFSYPAELFPPTDFHTATLVGDAIYIIGCLGYMPQRQAGFTPVYRLDTRSYRIEPVATRGEMPGWISRHKACLTADGQVRISGGKQIIMHGEKEDYVANEATYQLCLRGMVWQKVAG